MCKSVYNGLIRPLTWTHPNYCTATTNDRRGSRSTIYPSTVSLFVRGHKWLFQTIVSCWHAVQRRSPSEQVEHTQYRFPPKWQHKPPITPPAKDVPPTTTVLVLGSSVKSGGVKTLAPWLLPTWICHTCSVFVKVTIGLGLTKKASCTRTRAWLLEWPWPIGKTTALKSMPNEPNDCPPNPNPCHNNGKKRKRMSKTWSTTKVKCTMLCARKNIPLLNWQKPAYGWRKPSKRKESTPKKWNDPSRACKSKWTRKQKWRWEQSNVPNFYTKKDCNG